MVNQGTNFSCHRRVRPGAFEHDYHGLPFRRPGITRLEMILVVLIFMASVGLLFTYLAQQRERTDQQHCADNLRHIGEAILGFHEEKKFLPAARIASGYATWAVQIAPHLDKDSTLTEWDLAKSYREQAAEVRQAVSRFYVCPARPRPALLSTTGQAADDDPVPGALGDYACSSGDGDPSRPWTGLLANGALILGEVLEEKDGLIKRWRARTSLADLVRGQSYTIVVGEKHVPLDGLTQAKAGDGSLYNGSVPVSSARIGGPGFDLALSPLAPFNSNFGSAHPEICQFLHADGSVRGYPTTLSADLLGKLIRRE